MRVSTTSHGFKLHLSSTCRGHLTSAKTPLIDELKRTIRDVNNFPKPGIVFKDVTPVLLDVELFRRAAVAMAEPYRGARITRVVAVETRGFLFCAPIAHPLGAGIVPTLLHGSV